MQLFNKPGMPKYLWGKSVCREVFVFGRLCALILILVDEQA